jgi:hypothetical protein
MGEAMESRPSYRWENEQILLNAIMNKLGITNEDLEKDPSYIKSVIRDSKIEELLEN